MWQKIREEKFGYNMPGARRDITTTYKENGRDYPRMHISICERGEKLNQFKIYVERMEGLGADWIACDIPEDLIPDLIEMLKEVTIPRTTLEKERLLAARQTSSAKPRRTLTV